MKILYKIHIFSYADDILCEEFPKRAYSVGSKASALASRLRSKIDDSHKYSWCYYTIRYIEFIN